MIRIIPFLFFILMQSYSIVHAEIFKLKDCYEFEWLNKIGSGEWEKTDYEKFTDQDEHEEYIFLVDTDKDMVLRYQQYTDEEVSRTQNYYDGVCEREFLLCDDVAEKINKTNYVISTFKNNIVETITDGSLMSEKFVININDETVEIQNKLGGLKYQCEKSNTNSSEIETTSVKHDDYPFENLNSSMLGFWTNSLQTIDETGEVIKRPKEGLVTFKFEPFLYSERAQYLIQTGYEEAFISYEPEELFIISLTDTEMNLFSPTEPVTKEFVGIRYGDSIVGVSFYSKSKREWVYDYSNLEENRKKITDWEIKHQNHNKIFIDLISGSFTYGMYGVSTIYSKYDWFSSYLDKDNQFPGYYYNPNTIRLRGLPLQFGGSGFVEIKDIFNDKINDTPIYAGKDPNELVAVASGSGFFINKQGNIVTNEHVVEGCNNMTIVIDGEEIKAEVIATDNVNDLALLKTEFKNKNYFKLSKDDVDRSQPVKAIGYGFGKNYSSDIKVTAGIVNSLSGYNDNYSEFQMDAAIQSGNSGGPVINEEGQVVGVSVAALDSIAVLEDTGTLPQNVNYAIKTSTLKQFLNSKDIDYEESGGGLFSFFGISNDSINDLIDEASVYLSCYMTYAQIEENMTTKVMFENIE